MAPPLNASMAERQAMALMCLDSRRGEMGTFASWTNLRAASEPNFEKREPVGADSKRTLLDHRYISRQSLQAARAPSRGFRTASGNQTLRDEILHSRLAINTVPPRRRDSIPVWTANPSKVKAQPPALSFES
mmetsp:Transcript_44493/g.69598  ORF Transcript_44493/g.69598 Transcript_44493/m.69598 type:complete len:132 (-) Transcript_44493:157-552(-)